MNWCPVCVPCGSDIAIALHTPPHRAVSLALVAQALGATQGNGRLRRTLTTSFRGSFSLPKSRITSRKEIKAANVEVCSTQDEAWVGAPHDNH